MDRRDKERARTVFQSACIEDETGPHVAVLRDLSPSGAGFEADIRVSVGQLVHVRWGSLAPIPATVRWSVNGRFGVGGNLTGAFAGHDHAYRSVRIPLGLFARIYVNGRPIEGELINMSQGGAAFSTQESVAPGQLATIQCGNWTSEGACIKWVAEGMAGIRLAKPITLQQFSKIVASASRKSSPVESTPRIPEAATG